MRAFVQGVMKSKGVVVHLRVCFYSVAASCEGLDTSRSHRINDPCRWIPQIAYRISPEQISMAAGIVR